MRRGRLLHQELAGDGAHGGADAEEVGGAGPGADVEVGLEALGGEGLQIRLRGSISHTRIYFLTLFPLYKPDKSAKQAGKKVLKYC